MVADASSPAPTSQEEERESRALQLPDAIASQLQALGYDPTDAGLQEQLIEDCAANLEWLARVQSTYPLAVSVLWRAPNASTGWDQRRATAACMKAPTVGLILGGERSGKSLGLKQLTVAMALGGDHPMVRAWLELNDLPRDAIPDGPASVYAVAPSSNDSIRYHRGDIAALLPQGTWYNRNGKGEAVLRFEDERGKAEIWFKALDQGYESFKGISVRWVWIDEEPLGESGWMVYEQCKSRVADQDGRIGISMVPLEGLTWVHDKLVQQRADDAIVCELDTLDNPHLPKARFRRHFAGMDEDQLEQRRFGRFRSRSGLVYPTWFAGDGDRWGTGHLCEPFEIPPEWVRFRAGDFGLVAPTCVLWGALGDDDTLYIYREYYQADGDSWGWHARRVAELEGFELRDGEMVRTDATESIETGWGDPAALEARTTFAEYNVGMAPANNAVKGGIDRVKERLRLGPDDRPRLKVFTTCPEFHREISGYVWDPNRRDEVPLKKNDHAMDTVRYLCMGIYEWQGMTAFG